MGKFNVKSFIEDMTGGKVEVIIKDFPVNDKGEKTAYQSVKAPKGSNASIILYLDREVFQYANRRVAQSLLHMLRKSSPKSKEQAMKDIQDFIDRKGKYAKIKDRESKDIIRASIKQLKGFHLEALAYAAHTLTKDQSGDLAEQIYETVMNYDIN